MIEDRWFGGIRCALGMSKFGFQSIAIIKTGTPGYCKQKLKDKLKRYNIPREEHVAAATNLNGLKMIALTYRTKSDNGKKAKAKKANFLIYFSNYPSGIYINKFCEAEILLHSIALTFFMDVLDLALEYGVLFISSY